MSLRGGAERKVARRRNLGQVERAPWALVERQCGRVTDDEKTRVGWRRREDLADEPAAFGRAWRGRHESGVDSYEGAAQTEGDVERDCSFGWRGDAARGATGPGPLVQAHKQSPGVRDPARASEQFAVGDDEGKAVGEIDFGDREVRARAEQGRPFRRGSG